MRLLASSPHLPLLWLCFYCLAAVNGKSDPRVHGGTKEMRSLVEAMGKTPSVDLKRSWEDLADIAPFADLSCPDATAIEPCVCSDHNQTKLTLDCTFVESEEQLMEVFQQDFPVKEFYEFSMSNNSAVKMLDNIMNGITIESLLLYPGPFDLEAISDNFLLDLQDIVKEITIQDSNLTTELFPFLTLPSMNQLSLLRIIGSDINSIPQIRSPSLSHFVVSSSSVEVLLEGTISVGVGAMTVSLNNNIINTIELGSIFFADPESATSSELLSIELVGNRLQSLQAGTFQLRPGNFRLHIDTNQISSIEPGTFVLPDATGDTSYGDIYIDLAPNQLQSLRTGTFPIRNGEVSLFFFSNNITSIEPGTFVPSEAPGNGIYGRLYMDFAPNLLQSIQAGTFPLRNGAVTLLLHWNRISSIEPGAFVLPETTDSMVLYVDLGSNALTTIDEAVFGDLMPYVVYLGLYDNPLECGCDVVWLIQNYNYTNVVDDNTRCADGTNLHDLNLDDFVDLCLV